MSLLKQELERGRQDLEKVSKLRARCVMLDWYHNKQHGKVITANNLRLTNG